MEGKYRKFYVDWWRIKKSTIYGGVIFICLSAALAGGVYWLYKNDWVIQTPDNKGPKDAARIVSFQGDVRIIRVTTRKTERVIRETFVLAGDTIQTQSDGRAQIRMIDGSTLSIRPNSTVVIRDSTSLLGNTTVRVKLNDGQIRVRTEDQPKSSNNVVEVKESENKIAAKTEASFNLDKDSNRGEIRISRGTVESSAEGVTTTIKENEYATLDKGRVSSKEELLDPPTPSNPSASKQVEAGGSQSSIAFTWERPRKGSNFKYHLQVSRSPFFVDDKISVNENLIGGQSFPVKGLSPGTYFWRIRASADSGQMTEWSEPSRFTVVKSKQSVRITAKSWSVEKLGGTLYRVSGVTNPGATVKIAGRETFATSDGSFLLQISSSTSTVSVDIFDDEGNRGRFNLNLATGRTG
ncbi:MAG: FecR domain-containing protein [Pyrinomonadaceae bacterium]